MGQTEATLLLAVLLSLSLAVGGVYVALLVLVLYVILSVLLARRDALYARLQAKTNVKAHTDDIALADSVYVRPYQLSSLGISGMPGSGKSTYACYLLAQCTQQLYILDIHYPSPQSLGARVEIEGIPATIYNTIDAIEQHLSELREGITVIDEYTSLLRQKPTLKRLVLDYVQQGRKYGCSIWLIGQHWSGKSVGGTEIRDSLVAFAALRQRVKDGRMSTGLTDIPDTGKLKHGEVLLIVYGTDIGDVYTYR